MDAVDVDGLRIAFEAAGQGPALVLLHGAFSDSRFWRQQLESLSDDFTVVAWDAPGCGRSADPPATFRLPDYADCLAGFIDALSLEAPHVVGLSFGGGLALEHYRRYPNVPATLTLASAYAGWAGSLPAHEVEARLDQVLADAQRPVEEWVGEFLPHAFARPVPPPVRNDFATMMLDARPAGTVPMLRGFAEADLRDVLPQVRVPVLLLYGDADVRSPLRVAEEMDAVLPQSRLVVLPGIGHASNLEAPETFNEEVRTFLQSVAPSRIGTPEQR